MKNTLAVILAAAARKNLPCLLIGGNAVILLGFPRNTIDIDLLVPAESRSRWLDLMGELKFVLFHGTDAFAQFEPGMHGIVAVDLMFVDDQTWKTLSADSLERDIAGHSVRLPQPERLPVFDKLQKRWRPKLVDWGAVMDETEPLRQYYLDHFDTPEKRLRGKNPIPFRMDF